MLTLKSARMDEEGRLVASYEAAYCAPGQEHNEVSGEVTVAVYANCAQTSVHVGPCEALNTEDALDKLASQLEHIALALRERGEPRPIIAAYD